MRVLTALLSFFLVLVTAMPPVSELHSPTAVSETKQGSESSWQLPLAPPFNILRHFEAPQERWGAGHRGVDLSTVPDEKVLAPTSGTVTFVGRVVDRGVLTIQVPGNKLVSFEPVETGLEVGDGVLRGEEIAVRSEGGHCESRCLHIGVRHNGEYINPLQFYFGKPVLLPW